MDHDGLASLERQRDREGDRIALPRDSDRTPADGRAHGITGIACRMGFSDSQYFARVFRKYMGETPSEYRDRALAERHA